MRRLDAAAIISELSPEKSYANSSCNPKLIPFASGFTPLAIIVPATWVA